MADYRYLYNTAMEVFNKPFGFEGEVFDQLLMH